MAAFMTIIGSSYSSNGHSTKCHNTSYESNGSMDSMSYQIAVRTSKPRCPNNIAWVNFNPYTAFAIIHPS